MSRYEKVILGVTAAFLLFTGGWFLSQSRSAVPYEVTASRQDREPAPPEKSQADSSRPESLLEGETINVNTAGLYDLQRLPGIGEKRALAILDWREEHGPFQRVEDLIQVPGIGEGILAGLAEYAAADQALP